MDYCHRCGRRLPEVAIYCPNCGTERLDDYEYYQISSMINKSKKYEVETHRKSKNSFLEWLANIGLGTIVSKLISWAWTAIKTLLGFF